MMRKIRQRQAQGRNRILNEFNRSNLDDVGPIGGADQGMKNLSEMNALADDHDEFLRSLAQNVEVL